MRAWRTRLRPGDVFRLVFIAVMAGAMVATIAATDARQANPDFAFHKGGLCLHNPPVD